MRNGLHQTLVLTAVAGLLLATASPSLAGHLRKRQVVHHPVAAKQDSAAHDRAVSCDPAGQYSGYPDWARAAFSCGSRR